MPENNFPEGHLWTVSRSATSQQLLRLLPDTAWTKGRNSFTQP